MTSMIRNILRIIATALLCILPVSISYSASEKQSVNILTWWGYLNHPEIINTAEKHCGVKISFDQYYSNDEFLRRWREQKSTYDIIIFSNTIYAGIRDEIKHIDSSKLWKQVKKYNPTIKRHYMKSGYPKNIVYFVHSLTGFMYNPEVISLSAADSIFDIFKKAANKIVIIIDDPVEARELLIHGFTSIERNDKNILNSANFTKLTQDAKVYIGNGIYRAYKLSDFSFSFTWSGEAIKKMMVSDKKLKFLIHPKLSYISSDLLAQLDERRSTECVATYLTSADTLAEIEINHYYFSSYTNTHNIINPDFRNIYKKFLTSLPSLRWVDSVNSNEFGSITRSWDLIKLDSAAINNITQTDGNIP